MLLPQPLGQRPMKQSNDGKVNLQLLGFGALESQLQEKLKHEESVAAGDDDETVANYEPLLQ